MTMSAALPQSGRRFAPSVGASPWGPGAQRRRATRLLIAGLVATNMVAGLCALAFGLTGGRRGFASALLAAAVVIVFFGVGQGVQVAVAELSQMTALSATLGSYALRVVGLGVLLNAALPYTETGLIDKASLMVTLLLCVGAWIAAEVAAFGRLRFPVYDTEYVAPEQRRESE